jgi:hypothetical protein
VVKHKVIYTPRNFGRSTKLSPTTQWRLRILRASQKQQEKGGGRNQMDECHPGWGDFHTIRALMEKWGFGFLCTLDEVVDRAGGKKWTGPTPFLFCY